MKQEPKMVAVRQEVESQNRTVKATVPSPPLVSELDGENGRVLYKGIGRVLLIVAGRCMLMLHDGNKERVDKDTVDEDKNHSLGLAIVWGMIYGVAMKVVDLTQDHGLQISATKENLCYLMAVLDIYMLCTMVPGGRWFLAYQIVYHGLIKGKADTLKHVIMAAAVYSMCVYLVWVGHLSVDWSFIAITTCVSVAWSTLNNKILYMGDTYMNQVRVDVLLLMGNLLAFDCDRFIRPALITVAEHVAYAATKTIAKTQTWYVTSKREDTVPKETLSVELITALGAIQWLLAYALMLWEGIRLGLCPWPVVFGSYWLMWEFLDGFIDYFNKGSFKSKLKRILHTLHFAADFGLHILFLRYGLGTPFGVANPELMQNRVLYLATLIAMWMVVYVMCSWYGLSREIKYYGLAIQFVQHASMVRLPAYASSPLLMTAAWVSILGNLCYVPKICSHSPPPKMVFSSLTIGLVVVGALCNIFRHQLCAIPMKQFIVMTTTWLVVTGSMTIFGQCWQKKRKVEHKNEQLS